MRQVKVGGRSIGPGERCYVVAEISGNHNQDFDRAVELIRAAQRAGADAVKTQAYTADSITIDVDSEYFRMGADSLWAKKTLYQLYTEAGTPLAWQAPLQAVAKEIGIEFFSTPFDLEAVEVLESIDVPVFKIASFENTDTQLLRAVARTGKPVIVSTGMASLTDIDYATRVLRENGASEIVLLKCTSAYPAPPSEMNLRTIPHLAEAFDLPVGLSDHTMGAAVPVAAVALGACVVEKHFTLSRSDGGPDAAFSLEPEEFAAMVRDIRVTEQALGRVSYQRGPEERKMAAYRRSIFVVRDVKAGEAFSEQNLRCIRPGFGLSPRHLDEVLGAHATRDILRGTPLSWDLVGGRAREAGEVRIR